MCPKIDDSLIGLHCLGILSSQESVLTIASREDHVKYYTAGPVNYTSTHASLGMLLIGSSRKPIVLHEISNRIPLVIGNLALKSFNIEVNEQLSTVTQCLLRL